MKVDVYKRGNHTRYENIREVEFETLREGPTDLLHLYQKGNRSVGSQYGSGHIAIEIVDGDKFSVGS